MGRISVELVPRSPEGLREDLRQVTADNKSSHARLWDRVNEHSELLNDHETRLQAFENKYR